MHLWPNAFKERTTAIAHQKLHQGDLTLYRANIEDLGGLYNLNFASPDQIISWLADTVHIDYGWIILSNPLLPGATIHITSQYTLHVPKSFSRLGRTGSSYQLTQWYPHLAVFDEQGWHMMPNLDQGEYFNDFADYEVTITTPATYKVAATGSLINEKQTGKSITREFHAENMIDFAWFASPHFTKISRQVDVGNDSSVQLNVYIENYLNDGWDKSADYAERALKFYSEWLGPYPYPQMTIVHTPFSKAGYMEYPSLSQISYTTDSQLLDRVIAHEIGHTWLYGVLANNEREHPWMDEGLNSFIENEYMHAYYSEPVEYAYPKVLHSHFSMDHFEAMQHILRATGTTEPPETSPLWQKNDQYIASAYLLPSQGLRLMAVELGREKMKQMFRAYYNEHKFSHVSPADLQATFERSCDCDLSWFFDGWLHHSHEVDYRFKKIDFKSNEITVENRSTPLIPLTVTEYENNAPVKTHWIDGFEGEKNISLADNTDEIRLYDGIMGPNKKWWDNIRPNNIIPAVGIVPKIGNYHRPTLALTPVVGYNLTDGGLPGIAITTDLFPQPRLKLFVMPMYGVESKKVRFYGEARYASDIRSTTFDKFLLGMSAQTFGYNVDTHYLFRDHFQKLSPFIGLRFKNKSPYSHLTRWLKYRYVDISQHFGRGINFQEFLYEREERHYGVHEASFQMSSDTVIQPYTLNAAIQAGSGFVRLNFHYNQHFRGRDKMQGLWVHGFLGWLPVFNNPLASVAFTVNGSTSNGFFSRDYMYDEWLIGRNATEGNISRQIFMKDTGFKTLAVTGFSEKWMAGAGVSFALPLKVLHAYMDAAVYDNVVSQKTDFIYSGGLAVILMKDAFEIYIPLLESKEIRESLTYIERDQWFDRISFMANFKLANPLYLVDRMQYKY